MQKCDRQIEFLPKKSSWQSEKLDEESVLLIRNILIKQQVKTRIEEGGTTPNIDGYIELLDIENRIIGKLTVQVKHLTESVVGSNTYYDIPQSILAYAERIKGEVVIFMTCDTDREIVYWKYIDEDFIRKCKNKKNYIQETYIYHFSSQETLTKDNVQDVISKWNQIYVDKKKSITDDVEQCRKFIALHKQVFNNVQKVFFNLPDSHIFRKETDTLLHWIKKDLSEKESPIKLLVGKAGVGKSVVIKELIEKLEEENIVCMAIKANRSNITNDEIEGLSLQTLQQSVDLISSEQDKIVLIIDQIDALSQYLSNDRNKLNNLLSIVTTLQEKRLKDVRIVISCRQYDLEYDATLKVLKAESSTIELAALSTDEVKGIVSKLDSRLPSMMSLQTLKTLSIPQYLDIFCRIYKKSNTRYEFNNYIELYDALWEHLFENVPTCISAEQIESFLYKIFHVIQAVDTLSPTWTIEVVDRPAIGYLASKSVIILESHHIAFFHQSFYDYVQARYYVTRKESFINELSNMFQGLEIRSTVKLLLDFERASSNEMYRKDLETIIFSDRIRSHIKQLALTVVAYGEEPQGHEKKIVRQLYRYDSRLFSFFVASVISDGWFDTIFELIEPLLPDVTLSSKIYESVTIFLCKNAYSHVEEIYELINSVKDETTKSKIARSVLYAHNDYSVETVRNWYYKLKGTDYFNSASYIQDALKTNLNFALYETENLLLDYLRNYNDTKKSIDDYVLIEQLCKNLLDNHPKEFLFIIYRCFTKIAFEKRLPLSCWKYYKNSIFEPCQHGYVESIYEWLETLLEHYIIEDFSFVKPLVVELLNLNDEMSLTLAFKTMRANPQIFDQEIWQILSDNSKIDKYLDPGEFEYYFLTMLKTWYCLLDRVSTMKYQNVLLTFKSETDCFPNRDRRFSRLMYPHLWRRKWMLACSTLPSDSSSLTSTMRKCKQELIRRFGYEYKNDKPNHQITCAQICGGIVSDEQYAKFSIKTWKNVFRLSQLSKNGKYWLFDKRVQAKAFMSSVAKRPEYFKNFIFEIFKNKQVPNLYKINGLLGLLSSGYDIIKLSPLFKQFLSLSYIQSNPFGFEQMVKYYTRKENSVLDEIISILIECIRIPFNPRHNNAYSDFIDLGEIVRSMLTDATNSSQGIALKILIEISAITSRRDQILNLFGTLQADLSEELKLDVIRCISSSEYYNDELFDKLYPLLISNMGTSALLINPHAIQYYYYNTNKPFINKYIDKIILDERSHIILSQIFFYGTACQGEVANKCSKNLAKILSYGNESVISKLVEVSMNCLSNIEFSKLSKTILLKYAEDKREEVVQSYRLFCHKMPVTCIDLFLDISKNWRTDKQLELHCQLNYIEKCISRYPVKCYRYIRMNNYWLSEGNAYHTNEVVKILLLIYKKLKNDEDRSNMNEIMDIFDLLLLTNSVVVNNALKKMNA